MKRLVLFFMISLIGVFTSFSQGFWTQKSNTGTNGVASAAFFSLGGKGYMCCGIVSTEVNTLWQYDPLTNTWTQKANFPGLPRRGPIAFTVGNKAYVGMGHKFDGSYTYYSDLYEYDASANTWTQKASFPGTPRSFGFEFSIEQNGYFGGGFTGSTPHYDLWQYNPSSNTWTQKNNFTCSTINATASFSNGKNAYIGVGSTTSQTYSNDFWEYDQTNDSWTQKASLPGPVRFHAVGFSMYNYGYIATGNNASAFLNDLWQYDIATNTWTQLASIPASGRREAMGFSINNKAYVGGGYDGLSWNYLVDFWEYTPSWYGIENSKETQDNLNIYPNPANENITIETISTENDQCIFIYNIQGQLINQQPMLHSKTTIDISTMSKGMYILKFRTGEGMTVKKFMKE